MSVIQRLSGAAYGTHFADQIALVSVPLIGALAFGASPQVIGVLVACQSMAHLLGSIPLGVLVDRMQLRGLAIASAILSLTGFLGAALGVFTNNIHGFAVAITLAGLGVVLFSLTALSILPKAAEAGALARANSSIEIPRALCSFAVPLGVGLVVTDVPAVLIFVAASFGSVLALAFAASLPRFEHITSHRAPIIPQILEGGQFVLKHRLLRAISLCAIFWNLAFAALLVVLVPAIQDVFRFNPGAFGIALSAFGLAAVAGSWTAGRFANLIAPWVLLLFGPASSALAAILLLFITEQSPAYAFYACFLVLGFGPSMWLIAQNSVRQLVTPPAMLGRVNAVIQTAIYGIRPLGALIGGVVAGTGGATAGLSLVAVAFTASFAAALFSGLRHVRGYDTLTHKATV